ncbi:MAG: FapA family protein, partial [bacterium]|nr:FapA family protein [bacterium]
MHLSKDGDKIKTALSIVVEGLATWVITPPHQNEVEKCKAFLGQAIDWCGKMPVQRVRDAALAVFRQLAGLLQPEQNAPLPFLLQAMHAMGPAMTISNDQMAVFVTIPKELAFYWTPESLIQSLRENGIEHGLQAQAITQLFEQRQFDQLVCVARGKDPIPGENARLQWLIDL